MSKTFYINWLNRLTNKELLELPVDQSNTTLVEAYYDELFVRNIHLVY